MSQSSQSVPCPICGEKTRLYCRKAQAEYHRCRSCGLIYQQTLPTTKDMVEYADDEYKNGVYKDYVAAKELKYATFRARIPRIQSLLQGKNGKLLDVGCSCGYFIDVALKAGFDAYGVEFSSVAIKAAAPETQPRITQGDVNALKGGLKTFDAVTAFDIVEHTSNPVGFLKELKSTLRPGGIVVLSTPDTGHYLRSLMGSRWPMLQPMQHTYLFSRNSMRRALESAGFTEIEISVARKVLTIEYLLNQIKIHNPVLFTMYRGVSPLMPEKLKSKPWHVNIGEIFATARRPTADQ